MNDNENLRVKIKALQVEHSDLDHAIQAILRDTTPDMLRIQRLKKRKLLLKDQIERLMSMLLPDIIA
ncbi:MAG: DUF465 domain-containing protein [Alphaproteobacteria bacterium]|nr:DUF465 domain-containing protein [Alphaproteobacteria bacterium]